MVGDGAVGLCGVLAARRVGAERIILRTTDLDSVPDSYRAMNNREAIKVMVRP